MTHLSFQGQTYACEDGETVLESLTRQGATVPSSCRSGACQTCLVRALNGVPPVAAQEGLKNTLRAQNYFLACVCRPTTDLEVALPTEDVLRRTTAIVITKEPLNQDILRLTLQCRAPLDYRPGQFVHVARPDGLTRSYSVASLPHEPRTVELHVRRLPGGVMSGWLHDTVAVGDELQVAGPSGNCFYTLGKQEQGLLLVGTGSGLAPLLGIARDALHQGHAGPIHLFHGSWNPEGLYLVDELLQIAALHANFTYTPCVDVKAPIGYENGRADQVAFARLPAMKNWRVYLCGHPEMVKTARKRAFLAGASMKDIYADPFVISPKTM